MKFLILCLISVSAFATPRQEVSQLLNRHQDDLSTNARMEKFSSEFLGLPYGINGPLGEGKKGRYDQDPLFRFDTFDCTTFVETVVSLALSKDTSGFESTLQHIRYENGEVDYLKRNHFPSLQWVPNNIQNGVFLEANESVLPLHELKTAEAWIDLPQWLKKTPLQAIHLLRASEALKQKRLDELHEKATLFSPILAKISYIPIARILEEPSLLDRIPNASIVSFVRPNWDLTAAAGTHMNVSHQGLIFQTPQGTILRHASAGAEKKVMDNNFLQYLIKFKDHPTLKGIHLLILRN